MIALINRPQNIRIVFTMLLIFFTGCKIITPVYKMVKAVYKEAVDVNSCEENNAEQTAEKDPPSDKAYYQNSFNAAIVIHNLNRTAEDHLTDHTEDFLAGHVREISSPPPDRA